MDYFIIVKNENINVFKNNISALCLAFGLSIDAVGKQLRKRGKFACLHSGTTVEPVSIPILEYKVWRRTHKSKLKKA